MAQRKRLKTSPDAPSFNAALKREDLRKGVHQAFTQKTFYKDPASGTSVTAHPFPACVLKDVFPAEFTKAVRDAVLEETFFHKSNDLYEFYQSEDLRLSKSQTLVSLREAIYSSEFLETLSALTGIELNSTVDLSAHRYPDAGYLLCHDDHIGTTVEGRRIAFILYLVEDDWSEKDGGNLELYDRDKNNQPTDIVGSLTPAFNSLAFFEVGTTSYHRVAEVTGGRERVSISGWFHGPLRTKEPLVDRPSRTVSSARPINDLELWINKDYLPDKVRKGVSDVFVDESCIRLEGFLREEVYQELLTDFESIVWDRRGPATVRQYGVASITERSHGHDAPKDRISPLWKELEDFFLSEQFAAYLESLTELRCVSGSSEIRKFSRGDYTLMHDDAIEPEGLDMIFSCVAGTWDSSWGGVMHYVNETENVLSISPAANTLDLMYRVHPTQRFIKYMNHTAREDRKEISLTYAVVEDTELENKDDV